MKTLVRFVAAFLIAATSPLSWAQPVANDAAFHDMGGKSGIRKVVDDFLAIAVADPRIKDTFDDADMENLAVMLTDQFCVLTGGPCQYEGKSMKEVHDGMNLTNAHFNALAEDLQEAMVRNKIPYRAQYVLIAKLAPMQRDVVSR